MVRMGSSGWALKGYLVTRLLGLGVVALLALSAGPAAGQEAGEARVSMDHFVFEPAEITVAAGTTVTWTYDDDPDDPQPNCEWPPFRLTEACPGHSTTAVDRGPDGEPLWDSGVHRAEGFPYSRTFTEPGRYEYYCIVHGGDEPNNPLTAMNGVVVVTAAGEGAPAEGEADGVVADDSAPTSGGAGAGTLPRTGAAPGYLIGACLLLAADRLRARRR